MNATRFASAVAIVSLVVLSVGSAHAQVVEERKSDANPAGAIFRATLYGVGTGLVLGGAYSLVEDDEDVTTGDALKWGAAIGAAGGLIVGLVYVATRSEPEGTAEEIGLLPPRTGLQPPTISVTRSLAMRTGPPDTKGALGVSVNAVNLAF
jgi:hypothetical protein